MYNNNGERLFIKILKRSNYESNVDYIHLPNSPCDFIWHNLNVEIKYSSSTKNVLEENRKIRFKHLRLDCFNAAVLFHENENNELFYYVFDPKNIKEIENMYLFVEPNSNSLIEKPSKLQPSKDRKGIIDSNMKFDIDIRFKYFKKLDRDNCKDIFEAIKKCQNKWLRANEVHEMEKIKKHLFTISKQHFTIHKIITPNGFVGGKNDNDKKLSDLKTGKLFRGGEACDYLAKHPNIIFKQAGTPNWAQRIVNLEEKFVAEIAALKQRVATLEEKSLTERTA